MKESRLDQLVEICAKKSAVPVIAKTRESTASGANEGELLRRYWKDLMLEETRLDTMSPTGVEGELLRENKRCEWYGRGVRSGTNLVIG